MKKSILVSLAVLFAAVVAVGCKREAPTPTPTPTPTPKEYVYDVYVSGNSISPTGIERALLWENDQLKKLSTRESWAGTVSGSGDNVYVAGAIKRESPSKGWAATVWKNTKATVLDNSSNTSFHYARSLFVSDDNLYIAGHGWSDPEPNPRALIWKNDDEKEVIELTKGEKKAYAYSVFVSKGVVYAAGYEYDATREYVPILWKNKDRIALVDDAITIGAGNSVFVSGGNIYVVGWRKVGAGPGTATLWKNENPTYLTGNESDAFSVFVADNKVYVAGMKEFEGKMRAVLWIDGVLTTLSKEGVDEARALSVFVIDNDVYVAGWEKDARGKRAVLWKNGKPTNLNAGATNAYAQSVYVVKREKNK